MPRDVDDVLSSLIDGEDPDRERGPAEEPGHHLTSLGVPLEACADGSYRMEVTGLVVMEGLYTFVTLLADDVVEQCGLGIADIMVKRRVDRFLTPGLADVGVDWVTVYIRLDAADMIPWHHGPFLEALQTVFGAIQTARWGRIIFPDGFGTDAPAEDGEAVALLFPFHLASRDDQQGYFILVEYQKAGRFLRITVEDARQARLQLKHIPHRVVDNLDRRHTLRNIGYCAEQLAQGALQGCRNHRTEYEETPQRQGELFEQLVAMGLSSLSSLVFRWPSRENSTLLHRGSKHLSNLMAKVLFVLEDPEVQRVMTRGAIVEVTSSGESLFLDISRRGACLNVAYGERRSVRTLQEYLEGMPPLLAASGERSGALDGTRVFLIHHITGEVLGLMGALDVLGSPRVTTLFVTYAGVVPGTHLETILALPDTRFPSYALQRIEREDPPGGVYRLSEQYSSLEDLGALKSLLAEKDFEFLDAMRYTAMHLFLREASDCRERGDKLLLVEDGGYLAPVINRLCLEGKTTAEAAALFGAQVPEGGDLPFSAWLEGIFPGSIEHTRNGFDSSDAVLNEFGRLQFPVCSIAISHLKRGVEAEACSHVITNAVENILHRLGVILANRKTLVLGSSGAIGGKMARDLCRRFGPSQVLGVDLAPSAGMVEGFREAARLEGLEREELLDVDLVIGVTGTSIVEGPFLEEWMVHGSRSRIFFASGSTKTVEFTDLEHWVRGLQKSSSPSIAGHPVEVFSSPVQDLQTGVRQGEAVTIRFRDQDRGDKTLYLLGGLTPINFLYYGIPREIMGDVMTELLSISAGLAAHQETDGHLPARLLAVDRDIDADANLL